MSTEYFSDYVKFHKMKVTSLNVKKRNIENAKKFVDKKNRDFVNFVVDDS